MVLGDHVGEELSREPVVGKGIDLEGQAGRALRTVEDSLGHQDASIVDQDCRFSECFPDLTCRVRNRLGGSDVAFVEGDIGWRCVLQGLHVEDSNLHTALGEQERNPLADPIAATGHNRNLFIPVVLVTTPIVQRASVEEVCSPADEPESDQNLECLECLGAGLGNLSTLRRVLRKEK